MRLFLIILNPSISIMTKCIYFFVFIMTTTLFSQNQFNQFDENGERHGEWKKYFNDTEALRYTGTFEHGKEVGEFLFYALRSGKSILTCSKFFNAQNDYAEVKFFASNGFIISKGLMQGKLFIGEWLYFHKNSNKVMTKEFYNDQGKLDGLKTTYFKNSKLASEENYSNGLKSGISKSYSESGVLRNVISYESDEMSGSAAFYDASGNLIKKGTYLNGVKHGTWFEYNKQELVHEKEYRYGNLIDNN